MGVASFITFAVAFQPAPFRFLDLPRELRNQIYDILAIDGTREAMGSTCVWRRVPISHLRTRPLSTLPASNRFLALSQVCQQLARECRVYDWQARASQRIGLDLVDIPRYLNTFYVDSNSLTYGPSEMIIYITGRYFSMKSSLELLPLVHLWEQNKGLVFSLELRYQPYWHPAIRQIGHLLPQVLLNYKRQLALDSARIWSTLFFVFVEDASTFREKLRDHSYASLKLLAHAESVGRDVDMEMTREVGDGEELVTVTEFWPCE